MRRALVFNVGPGPDPFRQEPSPDGWRIVGSAYGGWKVKAWYQSIGQMIERNADLPRYALVTDLTDLSPDHPAGEGE